VPLKIVVIFQNKSCCLLFPLVFSLCLLLHAPPTGPAILQWPRAAVGDYPSSHLTMQASSPTAHSPETTRGGSGQSAASRSLIVSGCGSDGAESSGRGRVVMSQEREGGKGGWRDRGSMLNQYFTRRALAECSSSLRHF
jgi:hypothetical protein